jgi:aminoglycoside/choline kinase family phosphotransferase
MTSREAERARFLKAAGWGQAIVSPLAGDASFRRYFRLTENDRAAVLMDAPPKTENVAPFVAVDEWLRQCGLSAPEIFQADTKFGFVLLEDFGDDSFTKNSSAGGNEQECYSAAVDLIADLQTFARPEFMPPFDDQRIISEVSLFLDWFYPAAMGEIVSERLRAEFVSLWQAAIAHIWAAGKSVALFDYHADNLHWLPARDGVARVGLLDFQDAVYGPAPLDLVSLLEDARRHVDPELAEEMITRFVERTKQKAPDAFRRAFAATGAQRNTRIIGVFARLYLRDGKTDYLAMMPRVWRCLEQDLSHPALEELRDWFAKNIADELRINAPTADAFVLPDAAS